MTRLEAFAVTVIAVGLLGMGWMSAAAMWEHVNQCSKSNDFSSERKKP